MKLSICIPVFNSETTIEKIVREIEMELSSYELEFILVNDGSTDKTESVCLRLTQQQACIRFLSLARNFGEHNAVMCALNHCTGDVAIIIDDDFQNPPSEIIKLVNEIKNGKDVVYSEYKKKRHSLVRNLGSRFNNKVATWLLDKPTDLYLSSFKAIRRNVINEIIKYKGPFPYVDGLILRVTNSISTVVVDHKPRMEGRSNYNMSKLIALWLNMFINFSIKPLRFFTICGFFVSGVSLLFLTFFIFEKIVYPNTEPGWASLMVAITFFSGLQLIFLGVVAEYIGKSYLTANGTPQWVVKKDTLPPQVS